MGNYQTLWVLTHAVIPEWNAHDLFQHLRRQPDFSTWLYHSPTLLLPTHDINSTYLSSSSSSSSFSINRSLGWVWFTYSNSNFSTQFLSFFLKKFFVFYQKVNKNYYWNLKILIQTQTPNTFSDTFPPWTYKTSLGILCKKPC